MQDDIAMKNKSLVRRMFIGILIGTIILVGVFSVSQLNILPSGEFHFTQTLEKNHTSTVTSLPTSTVTATNIPTSTVTPTWTPLPTVQSSDVDIFVQSLHSKCKLPCWGNIIPGVTSEKEAMHLLASFGEVRIVKSLGAMDTSFNFEGKRTIIDFTIQDNLIRSINLPPEITKPYLIGHLLTEYGMPEDIQVEIFPETAEGTSWFNLVLLYPQAGFFSILSAEGTPVNSIINICPRDVSPDLYLLASNTYSLEKMNEIVFLILQQTPEPLEILTDIDKIQFYEIFRKQNNQCIATKVQIP